MKKSDIKVGGIYASKAQQSLRKVIAIGPDHKPEMKRYRSEPGVQYLQIGTLTDGLVLREYLSDFAKWAHHKYGLADS
jgi:hypothetical protein